MNSDRIKEIQEQTAYPESVSVKQALLQVWNECEQERLKKENIIHQKELFVSFARFAINYGKGSYATAYEDMFLEWCKKSIENHT
jgi:hypothetical protein